MARLTAGGPLRILADDLTGALDSAAAFGAGVPVHLGRTPAERAAVSAPPVEVLATATRDLPPSALAEALAPAIAWLAGAHAAGGLVFKKVDSLLRGNTFDELDRVARGCGCTHVLLAPAFPQQRRRTRAGWQWVDPPAADGGEPQPVGERSIADSLQRLGWQVDLGPSGPAAADPWATDPVARPIAWVPEVQDDTDLQRLAAGLLARRRAQPAERWLWVGSAGLAQALASLGAVAPAETSVAPTALGSPMPSEDASHRHPADAPAHSGRTWLVSASWHPVSRTQWARLTQVWPAAPTVRGGDRSALSALLQQLDREPPTSAPVLLDLSAKDALTADAAARHLTEQVALLAAAASAPRTLVVVGGDTLWALCQASGAQSLLSAVTLERPGWGSATLQGGCWHGLRCHTRSGAFGGVDDLDQVLRQVLGPPGAGSPLAA